MREYIVREDGKPGTISFYQKEIGELVRCKDCDYLMEVEEGYLCRRTIELTKDDWFCAGGRKKDGD